MNLAARWLEGIMNLIQGCSELQEAARLAGLLLGCGKSSVTDAVSEQPLYRGERLELLLGAMCKRGNLACAVVADSTGLPLADHLSPVGGNTLAAITSVFGSAIERSSELLNESIAGHIAMDINYTDKLVLRRFLVSGEPYFLLVICPQEADERVEMELTIEQIIAILNQ